MKKALSNVVRVVALAAAVWSVGAAPRDEASISLDRRIPQVRFEAVALTDAIDFLRDVGRLNLRVNWTALEAAGIDRTSPVTFYLRNITVRKALDAVLREAGSGQKLAFEVEEGVIEVTTQEEADRILTTEVYDIRDLLFVPLDAGDPPDVEFELEAVERGGGGGGGGNLFGGDQGGGDGQRNAVSPDIKGLEIVELIQSLIRPEVWQVNGGTATIRYFNGTLIVPAPRSVHELIGTPVRP
jgi:hypothetical protein